MKIWRLATGLGFAGAVLAIWPSRAEATPLERGRYLAAIAACIGCHTPRTPGAPLLSGGVTFGSGPKASVSANLTPDRETGLGAWSDAEIAAAAATAPGSGRRCGNAPTQA